MRATSFYQGGGTAAGAVIGGILGAPVGGVGALPGAVIGEGIGNRIGAVLKQKQCLLVPHTKTDDKAAVSKAFKGTTKNESPLEIKLKNPGNCCPGMTGHHLIPNTVIAHGERCDGEYNPKEAPTACAMGGRTKSTHGDLHSTFDRILGQIKDGEYKVEGYSHCGASFTMACAIEAAAESHHRVYKHCDKACIKKQLETHYDPLRCNPEMKDQNGHEAKDSTSSSKTPSSPAKGNES